MLTGEMLRSGLREAPPAPVVLTAGPLSVEFAAGEVRHVQVGGEEVARRIYVAVRDRDWGTVPLALSDLTIDRRADGFRVTFTATHRAETPEPIAFVWRGAITGAADGTLVCDMDGAATVPFARNRIGWCVLHPPATCAGQPCTVTHPDGNTTTTDFPVQIAPHQPFLDIRAMAHPTPRGTRVSFAFDGDVFETEDQRNWTDDSYKTYGTPLALPFPVRIEVGEAVRQSVTLRVEQLAVGGRQLAETQNAGVTITVGAEMVGAMPGIGLGIGAWDVPLTERETRLLHALNPFHLRWDVHLAHEPTVQAWNEMWDQAVATAKTLNATALFVALSLPQDEQAAHAALAASTDKGSADVPLTRFEGWLLFPLPNEALPVPFFAHQRDLWPGWYAIGGTDAYFTQLNRNPVSAELLDYVTFSINPQVHAFDNRSIAETLDGQTAVVQSARALYPDYVGVFISPVTLRPRRNPDATAPEPAPPPDTLPPQVDTRQLSLFAAGWTAMSVKHLAEAGVSGITYYELVGPCGVMERESGSPYGDAFPSEPGQVFPLYHPLADVGEFAGALVFPATSGDALRGDAFVIQHEGRLRVLVANLHDAPETVTVRLPGRYVAATVRVLDEAAAPLALRDPERWRTEAVSPLPLTDNGTAFTLALAPYAYACVDVRGD